MANGQDLVVHMRSYSGDGVPVVIGNRFYCASCCDWRLTEAAHTVIWRSEVVAFDICTDCFNEPA